MIQIFAKECHVVEKEHTQTSLQHTQKLMFLSFVVLSVVYVSLISLEYTNIRLRSNQNWCEHCSYVWGLFRSKNVYVCESHEL